MRDADGSGGGVSLVGRRSPPVTEIHMTVVDRSAGGSGVGTAMLVAIEADAISRGVRLL